MRDPLQPGQGGVPVYAVVPCEATVVQVVPKQSQLPVAAVQLNRNVGLVPVATPHATPHANSKAPRGTSVKLARGCPWQAVLTSVAGLNAACQVPDALWRPKCSSSAQKEQGMMNSRI
jgi:hypothetical protein